jgi:hypothetical protein
MVALHITKHSRIRSLFVLQGPPALTTWDGLLPISVPLASSPIVYKGRDAEGRAVADGASPLPEECFVAMNRFAVRAGAAEAFERRWAERESSLQVPARHRHRRDRLPAARGAWQG